MSVVDLISKSSKYGKPVWVTHDVSNRLKQIIKKSADENKKITPGDVIKDLLTLKTVPKYIIRKMKDEQDPVIKAVYVDILKYIIKQRKKGT